jgi:hypothetical protein
LPFVLVVVWIVAAGIQSKRYSEGKFMLFILVPIADFVATAFSHILWPRLGLLAFIVLPKMVPTLVHLTDGACARFLLHPTANAVLDKLTQRCLRDDRIMTESIPVIQDGDFDNYEK